MSHFLGIVVKLIKTHKPKDEGEKDMLKRFEDHTTVFIRLETILESRPKQPIQIPLIKEH